MSFALKTHARAPSSEAYTEEAAPGGFLALPGSGALLGRAFSG